MDCCVNIESFIDLARVLLFAVDLLAYFYQHCHSQHFDWSIFERSFPVNRNQYSIVINAIRRTLVFFTVVCTKTEIWAMKWPWSWYNKESILPFCAPVSFAFLSTRIILMLFKRIYCNEWCVIRRAKGQYWFVLLSLWSMSIIEYTEQNRTAQNKAWRTSVRARLRRNQCINTVMRAICCCLFTYTRYCKLR